MKRQRAIADVLLEEIEGFSNQLQQAHPLMGAARSGRIGPATIALYVLGLKYLFEHAIIHLKRARGLAVERHQPELAAYFELKVHEETGHAHWAENDFNELERKFGARMASLPESLKNLVAYTGDLLEQDPARYLAYVLFAEYLTVHAGDTWVNALVDKCNIPWDALTAVTKHVELDRHHVDEARIAINHLLIDSEHEPILESLHGVMHRFRQYLDELSAAAAAEMAS